MKLSESNHTTRNTNNFYLQTQYNILITFKLYILFPEKSTIFNIDQMLKMKNDQFIVLYYYLCTFLQLQIYQSSFHSNLSF